MTPAPDVAEGGTASDSVLPRLVRGRRRGYFLRLLGTGLTQAALALLTVLVVPVVLGPAGRPVQVAALVALGAGALVLGVVRARERVLAEQLGQHYVQEIRTGLVASGLTGSGPSLGITVARTTNDLTSVRNWVALGVAPLAVAVPVLVGVLAALALVDPLLVVAVAVPLAGFGLTVVVVAPRVHARARELRRRRGILAAHVADTVVAAPGIVAAGGAHRELRGVRRRGSDVRDAAVARAEASGLLRGSAAATGALATVAVLAVAGPGSIGAAQVATALTVVGILVAPISDLARVVEYRQSFLAARRILGPALVAGRRAGAREQERRGSAPDRTDAVPPAAAPGETGLRVQGLVVDGTAVPDVQVAAGGRLVLRSRDRTRTRAVSEVLAGVRPPDSGQVWVDGHDLDLLDARTRRGLVGAALAGWSLERGTLARAVRYRAPDVESPLGPALADVGLTERVATLPAGERTQLRRGGQPLDRADQARVLLARAVHAAPALVVVDHLDDEVDLAGREQLSACLRRQPGVVVLVSESPEALLPGHQVWDLDGHPGPDRGRA